MTKVNQFAKTPKGQTKKINCTQLANSYGRFHPLALFAKGGKFVLEQVGPTFQRRERSLKLDFI